MLRKRLHQLSLCVLALTVLLIVIGSISNGRTWVVRSSPTSEHSVFISRVRFGWASVHDKSGVAFPFYTEQGMNKNVVNDDGRTIAMFDIFGGRMGGYRNVEYSLVTGGTITVTGWHLSYVPQLILALVLPIAGLVTRARRYWPVLGIWDCDPHKNRGLQCLFNGLTAASLFLFALTITLWSIARFFPAAMPAISLGADRQISFDEDGVALLRVKKETSEPVEFKKFDVRTNGPWFSTSRIITAPYYILGLASMLLPLARGLAGSPTRRRNRRLALGLCPNCSYDLRMSKDRCPECGRPFDRKRIIAPMSHE